MLPAKETAGVCFARTHKGNTKTLTKGGSYWWMLEELVGYLWALGVVGRAKRGGFVSVTRVPTLRLGAEGKAWCMFWVHVEPVSCRLS